MGERSGGPFDNKKKIPASAPKKKRAPVGAFRLSIKWSEPCQSIIRFKHFAETGLAPVRIIITISIKILKAA